MAALSNTAMKARRQVAFNRRGQSVTYKRLTASSPNYKTGAQGETFTSTTETALVNDLTAYEIQQSNGRYQYGDRLFEIMTDDLPETPVKTSRIVFGSIEYRIVDIEPTSDNNAYVLTGRKV